MRYSFSSDDEELILAPRQHRQNPPPSYDHEENYSISSPRLSMSKSAPEYVMRDDERYPTPIEEDPGLHLYTGPMLPFSPITDATISPLVVSPLRMSPDTRDLPHEIEIPKIEEEEKAVPKPEEPRRYCGLRRRTFFILIALVALLIIIGIVVGVVVGLKLRKTSKTTGFPALTSSGVYSGTNGSTWNTQIAYANYTTGQVKFRMNSASSNFTTEQVMNLTIVPESGATAMSLASMLGTDGNIYLNLFYIYNASIVLANVSCTSSACNTIYNGVISSGASFPVSKTSGLAALFLESKRSFQVFYHNTDRYLTQLSTLGDGSWNHGATISGKAVAGSSISATAVGAEGAMTVLYVEDQTKELYYIQYNATWLGTSAVTDVTMAKWSPLTDFTSCWQRTSDTLAVFFTGSNKFIYELSATNASDSGKSRLNWSDEPSHDLTWLASDAMNAGIGSVAWGREVRFYRLVGHKLAQSALIDGVWSAKYI